MSGDRAILFEDIGYHHNVFIETKRSHKLLVYIGCDVIYRGVYHFTVRPDMEKRQPATVITRSDLRKTVLRVSLNLSRSEMQTGEKIVARMALLGNHDDKSSNRCPLWLLTTWSIR